MLKVARPKADVNALQQYEERLGRVISGSDVGINMSGT